MAYGNDVEYSSFMYKRIGHLRKHLDYYQGKVRTDIPKSVLRKVTEVVIQKFDVKASEEVELWMIRPALKELDRVQKTTKTDKDVNYTELYKYYAQVWCLLTGKNAPYFSPVQEQQIYMMFKAMQVPFEMYKPTDRKNFINYTHVIFKLCQKLEYTDHMRNFGVMKDNDKLKKVDALMKRLFDYNGWEWIPTPTSLCKSK